MNLLKNEHSSVSQFTTLLRMTSGQEIEPQFVLVEHSYARPWNWQSNSASAHPRKTLFLSKVPRVESEDIIDVERDFPSHTSVSYDLVRGQHLMSECERHVVFAKLTRISNKDESNETEKEDCDWEQMVNKSGWQEMQHHIFNQIVKILDSDHLARLALKNTVNEPIKRRAQIDKTCAKFRQALGRINWDLKLTHWLHNILLQHLSTSYLAAYLDILQTLKSKIPNLVDKILSLSTTTKGSNIEALNLLLKRPWDPAVPVLNQQKPCKLENLPIVIQVPSGTTSPNVPQTSRRIRFFNSQLQHLAKCIPISLTAESADPASILGDLLSEVQMKIVDCKTQYPSHPIVLLGWGFGAVIACHVSMIEKVSANVCLGFPMMDTLGKKGEADDPLLDMHTPSLFIIGEQASNATVDDLEDFRYHMQAETSLVIIAGANCLLKMSLEKRCWDGLTQSMVDRCIVDEIGDFLSQTCTDGNKPLCASPASNALPTSSNPQSSLLQSSLFNNPNLPPKNKRDSSFHRWRKLLPMNLADSTTLHMPSKNLRSGTALSQTLGLKIPVGISSVTSFLNQEGKCVASPLSTPNKDVEEFLSSNNEDISNKGKTLQKISDSSKTTFGPNAKHDASSSPRSGDSANKGPLTSISASSQSFATIPLGSYASLTRQRHHQMMQISENSDNPVWSWPSVKTSTLNSFTSRTSNLKGQEDTDSDVDICGLSSVTSTTTSTASESPSICDLGKGSGILLDVTPYQAKPCVPLITPAPAKRGRPPGRPRGSTNANLSTKGRGKEPSTSMAVLTFTGAAGNGNGVESAGKGISSLGRGVLTLSKGGTSTVRVYSASGQKIPASSNSMATMAPSRSRKSKGFLLTNISATLSSASSKKSDDKTKVICTSDSNVRITSTVPALSAVTANTSSTTTTTITSSGQVSLNLQGISVSRSVSFVNARQPTIMLLPSSTTTSTPNHITATNTTTTITSAGLKTTKSIIGVRHSVEELKSQEQLQVIQVPEENKKLLRVDTNLEPDSNLEVSSDICTLNVDKENELYSPLSSRPSDVKSLGDCDIQIDSSYVTGKNCPSKIDRPTLRQEECEPSRSVLVTKTPKTLVLGTKVVSSAPCSPVMKSNITFISSKALSKVFPSPDKLPPVVHSKSLTQSNSNCSFLKIPQKASSIRLLRSVGGPLSTSRAVANSQSIGNIVTKTFTLNSDRSKGMIGKRRASLDSATGNVIKRGRGTSMDQIKEPAGGNTCQSSSGASEPVASIEALGQTLEKELLPEKYSQNSFSLANISRKENAIDSSVSTATNKTNESFASRSTTRGENMLEPDLLIPSSVTGTIASIENTAVTVLAGKILPFNVKGTRDLLNCDPGTSFVSFNDKDKFQEEQTSCPQSLMDSERKKTSPLVKVESENLEQIASNSSDTNLQEDFQALSTFEIDRRFTSLIAKDSTLTENSRMNNFSSSDSNISEICKITNTSTVCFTPSSALLTSVTSKSKQESVVASQINLDKWRISSDLNNDSSYKNLRDVCEKEKTKSSPLKKSPSNKEAPRTRKEFLLSNPCKTNRQKDGNSTMSRNRVTRSSAKPVALKNKRHLRSSL